MVFTEREGSGEREGRREEQEGKEGRGVKTPEILKSDQ